MVKHCTLISLVNPLCYQLLKVKCLQVQWGYIRISQFAENTADDFETQFKELQSQGMKELVLNLRDNPGGLLSTTEKISNYIMPPGTLVTVQNRAGKRCL